MKTVVFLLSLFGLFQLVILVGGHYESAKFSLHSPGVYTGQWDQINAISGKQDDKLEKRVLEVQTD